MRSIRQRLTAWLALAALLWVGVAPSQGLILCFEPDGTIGLELADARTCEGRDEPANAEGPSSRVGSPVSECCACLDIPVSGSSEARVAPASGKASLDLAPARVVPVSAGLVPPCAPERPLPRVSASPPGALAHQRTVVLRV